MLFKYNKMSVKQKKATVKSLSNILLVIIFNKLTIY